MSSHHFVKEGQEPALLVLDALTFEVAGPLLEWAPLVIVAQSAIDDVLLWNIKVDVVLVKDINVSDFTIKLSKQAPLTIVSHTEQESAVINALHFLIRKKQNAVNILSANVIDIFPLAETLAHHLQISVMDGNMKWSAIASGHFEKWMPAKSTLFLKESTRQQSIELKGVEKVDGYYECRADGLVGLESEALFWVGETRFLEY